MIGKKVYVIRPQDAHRRFRGATGVVVKDTGPCVWVKFDIPSRWSNRTYQWFTKQEVAVMEPKPKGPSTHLNGLDALVLMDKLVQSGIRAGELSVIMAAEGVGKSTFNQPRYITAWKEGGEFTATGDNHFTRQADAEAHAYKLAKDNAGTTVVILQCVSVRQSRVVVVNNEAS